MCEVLVCYLKWLPPHSADPLPEFQFRDCGFVVSGTGFQNFRLRSVGISIFPALELPDFKISSFGASRFQYFRLRSSSGASKSRILNGNYEVSCVGLCLCSGGIFACVMYIFYACVMCSFYACGLQFAARYSAHRGRFALRARWARSASPMV